MVRAVQVWVDPPARSGTWLREVYPRQVRTSSVVLRHEQEARLASFGPGPDGTSSFWDQLNRSEDAWMKAHFLNWDTVLKLEAMRADGMSPYEYSLVCDHRFPIRPDTPPSDINIPPSF